MRLLFEFYLAVRQAGRLLAGWLERGEKDNRETSVRAFAGHVISSAVAVAVGDPTEWKHGLS